MLSALFRYCSTFHCAGQDALHSTPQALGNEVSVTFDSIHRPGAVDCPSDLNLDSLIPSGWSASAG